MSEADYGKIKCDLVHFGKDLYSMGKLRIKTFFVYKRTCKCGKCKRKMEEKELYFAVSTGFYETTKLCKKCWDNMYTKSQELYKSNEGKFGEYLKKRMVRKL